MAIDESTLTKGHLKKLNFLRQSVGEELGEEVFAKWARAAGCGFRAESRFGREKDRAGAGGVRRGSYIQAGCARVYDSQGPRQGCFGVRGDEEPQTVSRIPLLRFSKRTQRTHERFETFPPQGVIGSRTGCARESVARRSGQNGNRE